MEIVHFYYFIRCIEIAFIENFLYFQYFKIKIGIKFSCLKVN